MFWAMAAALVTHRAVAASALKSLDVIRVSCIVVCHPWDLARRCRGFGSGLPAGACLRRNFMGAGAHSVSMSGQFKRWVFTNATGGLRDCGTHGPIVQLRSEQHDVAQGIAAGQPVEAAVDVIER